MSQFIKNADGTVTDNKTGLQWSKPFDANVKFSQVDKTIAALGAGWRLPTVDELQTIIDRSRFSPAINTDVFSGFKNYTYWSSTPCAWNKKLMWGVGFDSGNVEYVSKTYLAKVVAVFDIK